MGTDMGKEGAWCLASNTCCLEHRLASSSCLRLEESQDYLTLQLGLSEMGANLQIRCCWDKKPRPTSYLLKYGVIAQGAAERVAAATV